MPDLSRLRPTRSPSIAAVALAALAAAGLCAATAAAAAAATIAISASPSSVPAGGELVVHVTPLDPGDGYTFHEARMFVMKPGLPCPTDDTYPESGATIASGGGGGDQPPADPPPATGGHPAAIHCSLTPHRLKPGPGRVTIHCVRLPGGRLHLRLRCPRHHRSALVRDRTVQLRSGRRSIGVGRVPRGRCSVTVRHGTRLVGRAPLVVG